MAGVRKSGTDMTGSLGSLFHWASVHHEIEISSKVESLPSLSLTTTRLFTQLTRLTNFV